VIHTPLRVIWRSQLVTAFPSPSHYYLLALYLCIHLSILDIVHHHNISPSPWPLAFHSTLKLDCNKLSRWMLCPVLWSLILRHQNYSEVWKTVISISLFAHSWKNSTQRVISCYGVSRSSEIFQVQKMGVWWWCASLRNYVKPRKIAAKSWRLLLLITAPYLCFLWDC